MTVPYHWDGDIPVVFMDPTDVVITIPRGPGKVHDELWYDREIDTLVIWDYNHPSGVPHVMAMKRGGEIEEPWTHISVLAPRTFHFVGSKVNHVHGRNPDGSPIFGRYPTHKCTVDLDRLRAAARRAGVLFDWMPITQFTTYGQITVIPSSVWESAAHGQQ